MANNSYSVRLNDDEARAFEDFYWGARLKPAQAIREAINNMVAAAANGDAPTGKVDAPTGKGDAK